MNPFVTAIWFVLFFTHIPVKQGGERPPLNDPVIRSIATTYYDLSKKDSIFQKTYTIYDKNGRILEVGNITLQEGIYRPQAYEYESNIFLNKALMEI
jgi:hypothetical protein